MKFKLKAFGPLIAAALLSFAPATKARADVWVYEVLTLRPEASPYQAEAYVGALGLIARRHGGVLVDGAIETSAAEGAETGRAIGLWRFRDIAGLDALLADPTYRSLGRLQDRTFDPATSRDLERVRALTRPAE